MNVVVATAEPFAAYHLAPLTTAARVRGLTVRHLLPIAHPTQGEAFATTAQLAAVFEADRVVITGGRLCAWTEAVAHAANSAGVPVIFVELAYLDGTAHPAPPELAAVLVNSVSSAGLLGAHLRCGPDAVQVVGSPRLDNLPAYDPAPGRVLALSTVSAESPDRGEVLADATAHLVSAGWEVVVRLHPREPRELWDGYALDDSPTAAHAATTASVVLGYPGTAFVELAAMGVPVCGLATEPWMLDRVPAAVGALCTPVSEAADLLAVLSSATPAELSDVAAAAGPVGRAADRIWDAVVATTSS